MLQLTVVAVVLIQDVGVVLLQAEHAKNTAIGLVYASDDAARIMLAVRDPKSQLLATTFVYDTEPERTVSLHDVVSVSLAQRIIPGQGGHGLFALVELWDGTRCHMRSDDAICLSVQAGLSLYMDGMLYTRLARPFRPSTTLASSKVSVGERRVLH